MSTTRIEISREHFENSLFPPHGRFSAYSEGPLVYMDATGPFNTEMIRVYMQTVFDFFAEVRARGPMVTLVEFHHSMLMSPDTVELMSQAVSWAEEQGFASIAVAFAVDPAVEGRELMTPLLSRKVFGTTDCRFRAFTNPAQAKRWLLAELEAQNRNAGSSANKPVTATDKGLTA